MRRMLVALALLRRVLGRSGLYRRLMWQIGYGFGPAFRSWLRKQWILFSHPHANIVFEGPVHIAPGFSLYMPEGATLIVGPNVEFRIGFRAEIVGNATVRIGARCVFSYYSLIQTHSDITIGEGCGFGQSFALFDGDHNFRDPETPFFDQGFQVNSVTIGNDCAILTKTTIIGADVGEHAVIGANAVVTKPVPAYSVAVGTPARVIDYFGPEDRRPPELAERAAGDGSSS